MNEAENFALVPSPPGALEKVEAGAKCILSGPVADTLALVKKEWPPKRAVRILTCCGDNVFSEVLREIVQTNFGSGCVVEVTDGRKATEILELVKQQPFDIIIPLVNNILAPTRVVEERILGAVELLTRLKAQYGMPIIALSGFKPSFDLPDLLKQNGIDAFFYFPFDLGEFQSALRRCLNIPPSA